MCGINGFSWKDEELINKMNLSIKHRGPDDEGTFLDENISLGHVRLSIIDLSEKGHQPMGLDSKGTQIFRDSQLGNAELVIVFNGEIYNYKEIKKELKGKFDSDSDTEVILRAYKKWGTDCVKKFNGMWSFAIYDKKKNILFCSRDRLGVKPFYYSYDGKSFVFSSELKGIITKEKNKQKKKTKLNKDSLKLYFSLGYIPSPMTVYEDVYKLEAGHNLIFNFENKSLTKTKYYSLPKFNPISDKKKLIEEGRKILYDATRIRMIADVPVGAFLSGGLDSSAVVGAMSKHAKLQNLHTFSIGFEEKYDNGKYNETKYVNIVKNHFKTKHHHYFFTEKDFERMVDKYSIIYDEPFADYSGFPTYKVSELAKKNVTVVLSGDGGDEIFGGYTTHQMGARLDLLRKTPRALRTLGAKLPFRKNLNSTTSLYLLKEAFKLSSKEKKEFYSESIKEESYKPEIYKKWTEEKLSYCLKKGNNSQGEALRIYDLLFNTLQDNFLVKVDRASMQAPVEVRSPFLDYRFVEFSQKIPTKWKMNSAKTKILMREIIKDIVPKEILKRNKQGFEPPLDKWIQKEKYTKYMNENVDKLKEIDNELYNFYTSKVLKEKDKFHNIYRIRFFIFIKWKNKWMKTEDKK